MNTPTNDFHPHQRWTLIGWLQRNPRPPALARLALALAGAFLLGVIGAAYTTGLVPTAYDRTRNCDFAAEQAYPPLAGVSVTANQSFPLRWQVFIVPGSCTSWDGVRLVRRNDTVGSLENAYPVGAGVPEVVPPGQPARTIMNASTIMTAPERSGIYETAWQLQAPNGLYFGPIMTRRIQVYQAGEALPPPISNQAPETLTGQLLSWLIAIVKYAAPVVLAFLFVWWRAGNFLNDLYGLKPPASGHLHVLAILFGLGVPFLRARRGKLEYDPAYAAGAIIGGPAWLIVTENTAVVIERGAGFSRIEGPGIHYLHLHERVRAAVDLNTQQRRSREKTYTKDGIPIEVDVDLVFKITDRVMDGDAPPSPPRAPGPLTRLKLALGRRVPAAILEATRPHRFSREAVRRTVYESAILNPDQPPDWVLRFANMRAGDISDRMAEMRLDEICAPEDPDRHPLREIVQAGLEAARQAGLRQGVDVLEMSMGTIEPPEKLSDQFTGQLIANWQVEWRRRARMLEAQGAASAMQSLEEARAEAQANMIQALTEGYRIAIGESSDPKTSHEVIALRFIDTLEALMQNELEKEQKKKPPDLGLVVS